MRFLSFRELGSKEALVALTSDENLDMVGVAHFACKTTDRKLASRKVARFEAAVMTGKKTKQSFDFSKCLNRAIKVAMHSQREIMSRVLSLDDSCAFVEAISNDPDAYVAIIRRYMNGDKSLVIEVDDTAPRPAAGPAASAAYEGVVDESDDEEVQCAQVVQPTPAYDAQKKARISEDGAAGSVKMAMLDNGKMQIDFVLPNICSDFDKYKQYIDADREYKRGIKEDERKGIRMQREDDLNHEDELFKRKDRDIKLDHERRMVNDDDYKLKHLQHIEAEKAKAKAEKDEQELKEMRRAEAANEKEKAEKKEAEKRAEAAEIKAKEEAKAEKNAERSRKAAATRKANAADKLSKEYVKGNTWRRLLLEPRLNEALKGTFPSAKARSDYINSLIKPHVSEAPIAPVDPNVGVYVIGYEGLPHLRYVGYSDNIEKRIEQHKRGDGATCVMGAKNITRMPRIYKRRGSDDQDDWERKETFEQMFKHGISNVRGWICIEKTISATRRKDARETICSKHGLCFRCGYAGHFAGECQGGISDWMA